MTDTVIARFEGDGSGVAALGDTAEGGPRTVPAMGAVR